MTLHASLSASLGSLFVLLAGANVWVMLHASSRSKDHAAHARLMWAHLTAAAPRFSPANPNWAGRCSALAIAVPTVSKGELWHTDDRTK